MEQDRTPPILVHHSKLARQTAAQLSRHRRADRRDDDLEAGLTVRCELDTKAYPKGIVVSDEQMKGINIQPEPFHGEWNYSISPSIPSINQSG